MLFVLTGEVAVRVNDRPVATRLAGTHVGEMALVDPLSKRSATIVANEPTEVLRVAEHHFSLVARRHPDLWRGIAIEIGNRLRERNRSLRPPNADPMLFIGSSSENLRTAAALHQYFSTRRVVSRLWSEGVFRTSRTSIESLVTLAQQTDFAALLLTADDTLVSRRRTALVPRDNMIFELGLLIGSIGRERVFIVKPAGVDIKIPSDLFGVVWLEYPRSGGPLSTRLHQVCLRIGREIRTLGPR
ncbi:MAG: nucleotide-binding protein [Gemmatimonadales bacterium]|nr:nucleotide-binding protein [Gemmatimonadales bacterium]